MPRPRSVPPGLATKAGYATHRGCSESYIHRLVREGKLAAPAVLDNGLVNIVLADRMLGAQPDGHVATAAPMPIPAADQPNGRERRVAAQAELAELELQRRRGELMPRDIVLRCVDAAASRARARLLEIPGLVSIELSTLTDPARIEAVLMARLAEALGAVSKEFSDHAEQAG